MGTVTNIKVEPMEVYVGTDQPLVQTISCVADSSSSLQNKYLILYESGASTRHYFWFNVATAGADPALSGYTGHAVAISANASASAVATALQGVIDPLSGFIATVSGSVVTVTGAANGYAAFGHDAQATASKTGFAFLVTQVGDAFEAMGYLGGDISVSGLSRSPVDLKAHQEGNTVIGQILTGAGNPELSFKLEEVNSTNFRKLLRYSNGEFYPISSASTSGMGGGSGGQFKSPTLVRVVLHPVRLGIADKTNDFCFWKCVLDLESVAFSGEKVLELPVKAKAFKDSTKESPVDVWMFGDWSQSFVNT